MQDKTKQRGRPKGSNSFVKLKLTDLISIVGADGIVEQIALLGDHAHDPAPVGRGEVAHIDAVDQHPTGGGIGQPHQQGRQRRLAGTRWPHDGYELTSVNLKRYSFKNGQVKVTRLLGLGAFGCL